MKSQREIELERLLAQFIRPIKNIPFELVIQSLFGMEVKKFDLKDHGRALSKIAKAMSQACKTVQENPIQRLRSNEAGNDMEKFVLQALKEENLPAGCPAAKSGRGKSAGYPDLRIETGAAPIYLEIKTHSENQIKTSLRSFFLSPAADPKVAESAFHLLACFVMSGKGGRFAPSGFKIMDLHGLSCDMKFEFHSDNRRLYQSRRMLARGDSSSFHLIKQDK